MLRPRKERADLLGGVVDGAAPELPITLAAAPMAGAAGGAGHGAQQDLGRLRLRAVDRSARHVHHARDRSTVRGATDVDGHQAVLRALYAYLVGEPVEHCPHQAIPLHTLIENTPSAYGCDERRTVLAPRVDERRSIAPS